MTTIKKSTGRSFWLAGLVLTTLVAGCNSDNGTVVSGTTSTVPQVLSTSPLSTATAVALDSIVVATFSEEIDEATLTDLSFTVTGAGVAALAGVVTYDAPSKTASFTASTNFTADTVYTATLTTAVTSVADIPLATDRVWSFTSALPVPLALSTSPQDKATAVAPNSNKVVVTFSGAMEGATLTDQSFTLIEEGQLPGTVLPGTVTYDDATKTASFEAADPFTADTLHTARLTTAVKSAAGIPLATDLVWTFTSGSAPDTTPPTASTDPIDGAVDVLLNRSLTATFDEALDPATINESTFTLSAPGTPDPILVPGVVSYSNRVATFNPTSDLAGSTAYTATLTTAISDLAGNALAANIVWSFTTGDTAVAGPAPVNLRTAGDFVILTKTGITNVPTSAITGNIGASPITAAAMDNVFCTEITGTIYGANDAYTGSGLRPCFAGAAPDNTLVANAVLDMGTAITDAAGRTTPDFTELHAGDISGQILVPGLYKWSSGVLISTDVTLNGGPNDVWIFQIAQNVTQENNSQILLAGGAQAKNIFWQVSGGVGVAIGTNAVFQGVVLAEKGITVNTGSSVNGRLLSQTAVTLNQNAVTQPAP